MLLSEQEVRLDTWKLLMYDLMIQMNAEVQQIVITDLRDSTYYATDDVILVPDAC